ncbi:MAG: cupredoxin domain-containing protein [Candidatus Eremiobacteraeota bacterium]|nr:cupredoxin domain-containing protein [Candidatus Eremiobacteraeota bacterium]
MGAKFNYVKQSLDAEVGYFAAGGDLGGAGVYSQDVEKTLQWRLAYANPVQPLEYGVMGARGSLPLAEGGFDQYTSLTPYIQRDPLGHFPGIFAMYQMGYDANAGQDASGNPLGASRSTAATIELYKPLGDKALIAVRKEFQNDGFGNKNQSGNVDFAYHLAPYLHLYMETAMTQNATPTWKYSLWWTMPLQKVGSIAAPAPEATAIAPAPVSSPATKGAAPVVTASATPIVTITASNWKFSPNSISLKAAQTTRLRLTSSSGVHGIHSAELGIPLTVIPNGKFVSINVTPKKAGTYVLHCAIECGPGHKNMTLTIVVAE